MKDVDMATQMELNIDERRLRRKVKMYEIKAKEDNKKHRTGKKQKDYIAKKTDELMHQFGLDKK